MRACPGSAEGPPAGGDRDTWEQRKGALGLRSMKAREKSFCLGVGCDRETEGCGKAADVGRAHGPCKEFGTGKPWRGRKQAGDHSR